MASENADNSSDVGCGTFGFGCLGVVVVGGIGFGLLYWFFTQAFFYYPGAAWGVLISLGLLVGGSIGGAFVGGALFGEGSSGVTTRRRMEATGPVLLALGVACLGTAIVMDLRPGFHYEETALGWETPDGQTVQVGSAEVPDDSLGILGPIEVRDADMRVGVRVEQEIDDGTGSYFSRWNFITVELLDENRDYLLSFGGDVWNYAGYDDGEDWQEEDTKYETALEFPSPGTYYIRVRAESSSGLGASDLEPISVELYERASWGNPVPLRWAAYLAFLLGGICLVAPRVGKSGLLVQHLKDGGTVRYDGQTWRASGHLHCAYDDWMADEWSLQPTDPGVKVPRYLEHEYEADSNWENWLISRPVELEDLRCPGPDGGETTVQQYVSARGELPDTVMLEGTRYSLDDSGTVRREGTPIPYHNYSGGGDDFVTIEGRPSESLDAVVGGSISVSDLSVVADDADSA